MVCALNPPPRPFPFPRPSDCTERATRPLRAAAHGRNWKSVRQSTTCVWNTVITSRSSWARASGASSAVQKAQVSRRCSWLSPRSSLCSTTEHNGGLGGTIIGCASRFIFNLRFIWPEAHHPACSHRAHAHENARSASCCCHVPCARVFLWHGCD